MANFETSRIKGNDVRDSSNARRHVSLVTTAAAKSLLSPRTLQRLREDTIDEQCVEELLYGETAAAVTD